MGSTCSSAQKKAGKGEEERRASTLSTESIPYGGGGGGSPRGGRKTSNSRPIAPAAGQEQQRPAATATTAQAANSKPTATETPPSTAAPSTATPNSGNVPTGRPGGGPGLNASPSHSEGGLPDLSQFPESLLPLLLGRWEDTLELPLPKKEITLYVGGCYSGPLRGDLWRGAFPKLRSMSAEKGYSLMVVDTGSAQSVVNGGSPGGWLDSLDPASPILCLLLVCECCKPLLLPPSEIAREDFETALQGAATVSPDLTADACSLLKESYESQGGVFRLNGKVDRQEELLNVLREVLPNNGETYLRSELEKELRWIVDGDACLAKRTLWLQLPPGTESQEDSPQELQGLKCKLQELVPDGQRHLLPSSGLSAAPEMLAIELKKILEGLIEEETGLALRMPYKGIENTLYEELVSQARLFRQLCSSPLLHREHELSLLKEHLQGEGSQLLVLHAPRGEGRTSLLASVAREACHWLADSTPLLLSLLPQGPSLRSTCEHLCALYGVHPSQAFQVQEGEHPLQSLLNRVSSHRPLVLLVDDFQIPENPQILKLLSDPLPAHLKIVLSVETGSAAHTHLQSLIPDASKFVSLSPLTPEQGAEVVEALSFPFKLDSTKPSVLEHFGERTSSAQAVLVTHWLKNFDSCVVPVGSSIVGQLIGRLGSSGSRVLSHLGCLRRGLTLLELLELIEKSNGSEPSLSFWQWTNIRKTLGPLVEAVVSGNRTLIRLNPVYSDSIRSELDPEEIKRSRETLKAFFGSSEVEPHRQVEEFPFLHDPSETNYKNTFLLNSDWLCKRVELADPTLVLEDIQRLLDVGEDLELSVLGEALRACSYALRYDGSQLFCQLYRHLLHHRSLKACPSLQKLLKISARPPKPTLLPISVPGKSPPSSPTRNGETQNQNHVPQVLHTMRGCIRHMLSLSPRSGMVTVWDVYAQEAVRTLTGVFEPKDAKMVDEKCCLLLCNRELKLYDLDEGCLVLKLKGVMNQHMAYYGLRESSYVVALSRNRMYVNMMNLNTGDLETTFKVGEDRFLNSLLVSGNGKICVCGDETQKPFPLLVWDLDNRKLLYDLRIPHHEFLTHLSAISYDGHYVVCVCKELDDESPNFIIVYDLQSGTLFKKWKPESDSCSIAISAPHGVVNGLNNSLVLVWDLVTGARKFNFRGHSAPVDQIKMDAEGSRCLTFDSVGRDRSVRLWSLARGECLAVLTPDSVLACAQLTLDGGAVVMGFRGSSDIVTFVLCHDKTVQEAIPQEKDFGDPQRRGKTADVSKQG